VQVFYQPIIRTATGKICGYEALARWIDPELGAISPAQFIPTLEEYHAIHKLDCFIVKKVCEDMRALIDQGEPIVPVSVNLSQLDFSLCDVFDQVERYRTHYGIDSDMIDIEITESALNENADHLQAEIKHFRDAGYHVWIDDFGSGYSSLNNLMSYDLDVLKLDLEFLRTYDRNPHAAALIKRIVQMSKDMDMQPLQEGVETAEHFEFLKSIECERAQGYYFAKPMAIDDSRKATRLKGLEWE
jgi:EAL domain-containing protein (putative c-di-GMP-specific phosphodiesterase class I)